MHFLTALLVILPLLCAVPAEAINVDSSVSYNRRAYLLAIHNAQKALAENRPEAAYDEAARALRCRPKSELAKYLKDEASVKLNRPLTVYQAPAKADINLSPALPQKPVFGGAETVRPFKGNQQMTQESILLRTSPQPISVNKPAMSNFDDSFWEKVNREITRTKKSSLNYVQQTPVLNAGQKVPRQTAIPPKPFVIPARKTKAAAGSAPVLTETDQAQLKQIGVDWMLFNTGEREECLLALDRRLKQLGINRSKALEEYAVALDDFLIRYPERKYELVVTILLNIMSMSEPSNREVIEKIFSGKLLE